MGYETIWHYVFLRVNCGGVQKKAVFTSYRVSFFLVTNCNFQSCIFGTVLCEQCLLLKWCHWQLFSSCTVASNSSRFFFLCCSVHVEALWLGNQLHCFLNRAPLDSFEVFHGSFLARFCCFRSPQWVNPLFATGKPNFFPLPLHI